jgi:hypothetical protein
MSAATFGRRPPADRPHLHAVPAVPAQPATAERTPSAGPSPQQPSGTAVSAREALFALLGGQPVHLTTLDLLALTNEPYDGLTSLCDLTSLGDATAAQTVLDWYLRHAGEDRRVNGTRARDLHYDLARYVLPFLLERRARGTQPLPVADLQVDDVRYLANLLAGERLLPASVVAREHLGHRRLALACHWLTTQEAAQVSTCTAEQLQELIRSGSVPAHPDADGQKLVRPADLRAAGVLRELDAPHGLSKDTAYNNLSLLILGWEHAVAQGVTLAGEPRSVHAKVPAKGKRQREPKPTKRVYVPVSRCAEALRASTRSISWCSGCCARSRCATARSSACSSGTTATAGCGWHGSAARRWRSATRTAASSPSRPATAPRAARRASCPPASCRSTMRPRTGSRSGCCAYPSGYAG